MVGERYSHSLDIGEELEKEKAAEEQQEEKKEQPAEEKQHPKSIQQVFEEQKPAPEPKTAPEEPEQEPAEPQASSKETLPNEEQLEGASSDLAVNKTDPVEEDINAIITKEMPELPQKKTVWANRWLLGVVFVVFVAGILFVWLKSVPKNAEESSPQFLEPVSLVVYNMTGAVQESMPLSEPVIVKENVSVSEPVLPSGRQLDKAESAPASLDELPDFLSERLKD
ncbi:MAG: hypothetical protein QXR48_01290 [Candidatus Woesearchaeota archaeon]